VALSNKQQVFIEYYLQHWNATQAALRAGYSEKTAYSTGQRLLKDVEVAAAIQARIDEIKMSSDEVLLRLSDQARGTMADFLNENGFLSLTKAEKAGKLHLIKSYSHTEKGERIELYDAQAALVHLGRHHKLFVDRQEQSGKVDHVHMTVDEWKAQEAERMAGADATMALFEDDAEGGDA
jgi:phage terminase small subunit